MIAEGFDTYLLDLDGVVYLGNQLLPGARSSLRRLRRMGKTLRFLTNDPRPMRKDLAGRLVDLGVEARPVEIVTCGWATATYLNEESLQSAYVVGSNGLRRELEQAGIELAGEEGGGEDVEAVVVGCDETICYPHIRCGARLIREGARFVSTNEDPTFPTPDGPAPATGTITAAVRTASGETPYVVGKPHPTMFEAALCGLDSEGAVMIGDRLDTDILGARRHGIAALLLRRGGEDSTQTLEEERRPDARISSLDDLFESSL
ncbi:HAD-IIA family hydrolase [Salinibacter sp.]|uniref:HAD-IIA family hydrolase n=1 Tax=Salinibacter sp. TaxID=2065818 RepID=UPI0021E7BC38|nr:HAD-IIA family hydrolase [Salinibacter sp.]